MKIGFIGCGNVAHAHADVLKYLGYQISAVCSRPSSKNLEPFGKKYNIPSLYDDWKEMLKKEKLDVLWVVASWNIIDDMLIPVLGYGIPTFFEKPVSLTPDKIEDAIRLFPKMSDKVQIGYNRRFYSFIPRVQELLSEESVKSVEIHIPESINGINDQNLINNLFVMNSLHVIDLLYFLLNKQQIEPIKIFKHIRNSIPMGFNGLLHVNNIPVHLIANWNTPSNFGIKFYFDDKKLEILPIEMAKLYSGFEINEPTDQNPVRRYIPQVIEELFLGGESVKFKPGFLDQTKNFFDTCVFNRYLNTIGSNLTDVLNITRLAYKIIEQN